MKPLATTWELRISKRKKELRIFNIFFSLGSQSTSEVLDDLWRLVGLHISFELKINFDYPYFLLKEINKSIKKQKITKKPYFLLLLGKIDRSSTGKPVSNKAETKRSLCYPVKLLTNSDKTDEPGHFPVKA